ncbi:uncharacterized protein NECHADRAFT_35215 [Fusarium vanettenii 77-13-4]|uniref:F-box domain-containing protein n=1 Tax=Fusarium vanettenii (strain ATCC MYA-4622 / CBS 123669 / FGSC 9596 / NRRL 45880 / 77-13-4) TaxID=660122 RepID=C7YN60_FUSV7|nr:uncharacterized protein NECHADRAFT_35215 [Fusarium vanettenii 77-13-4]EEU47067.1 hypothetical protein NECHADRAFT_35215 [Fusarium vanettenii 77-13-4]
MPSDKVLDICAYHRRDFDLVLVRSRLHETQSVSKSLQTTFETSPTSGLGVLDSLPVELLWIILRNLDLLSFFRFRHINRRARALATAVLEYRAVVRHGLEGLRGVLRGGLGQAFTIRDLYIPLVSEKCTLCGEFGGFLFLVTATRCCFACIKSSPDLRVISPSTLSRLAKISPKRLHQALGSGLRTVSGIYSMEEKLVRRPTFLVASQPAIARLQLLGLLNQNTIGALSKWNEHENQRFMASTAFPWYDPYSGKVESGVCCKGCQVKEENLLVGSDERDHVFSRSGYLSHFESCTEAQKLWDQSEGGARPVQEPEFTRRCGHFSLLDLDGLPR